MARHILARALVFDAMMVLMFQSARADEIKDLQDFSAARAVIERQLAAFAHDDAVAAYAEASPSITAKFINPDVFMSMVRHQYAPIFRHSNIDFGYAKLEEADTIEQIVTLTDQNDKVWRALYELSRQTDGTWLISSCVLVPSEEEAL